MNPPVRGAHAGQVHLSGFLIRPGAQARPPDRPAGGARHRRADSAITEGIHISPGTSEKGRFVIGYKGCW